MGASTGQRPRGPRARARCLVLLVVIVGLVGLPRAIAHATDLPAYAATASLKPAARYIGDAKGSSYTFTVTNTGTTVGIGAIEVDSPPGWQITRCPRPAAGWGAAVSSGSCQYRSGAGPVGDLAPGQSMTVKVVATTAPGKRDRTGTWAVVVSRTDQFDVTTRLRSATPTGAGLTATLHTFQVSTVAVTDAPTQPGGACPAPADALWAGMVTTIAVCGRNRASVALRPTAEGSSLGGSLVNAVGTFASAAVPTGGPVVLALWSGTEISRAPSTSRAVTTQIAAATDRTSYEHTFRRLVVSGHVPTAKHDSYTAPESSTLTVLPADGLLSNDHDDDGDLLTVSDHSEPAYGELTVSGDGSFSYQPDSGHRGADAFDYVVTDGTATTVATATVTTVQVNDAPTFTKGADQTLLEDAGAQSVSGWATSISSGPADEAGQSLTFIVTNDNSALFSAQPAVSPTGTLTYTAAPNRYGSATVAVILTDDGGTADGGHDTSATQTFTITVQPVNDPPGATYRGNQTALEDAGAQTVTGYVVTTDPGPHEDSQTTSLVITEVDKPALFTSPPQIDADGTLTYTPAPDVNGVATLTARPQDDGGTANGGDDTGGSSTFTIDLLPVNDEPTFAAGADQTLFEDAGAQSVSGWATSIGTGPAHESNQSLSFTVTNDNTSLFASQPAISPTGTLTYTAGPNRHGVATVTVSLKDDGGTANGGDDTSATRTFTITVTGVNDPPVASPKSFVVQTNMRISLGGLLTGSSDPADAAGDPTWRPSFTVESINPGAQCLGCTISNVNPVTGVFDFDPPAGGTGTYQVSYRVRDNGGPGPGEVSAPQTITFTVSGPVIWFVDPAAAPGGTGRLSAPFNSLAGASAAVGQSSNQRIFVMGGNATGNLALRPGGWLVSDAVSGSNFDSVMGITPPAGTLARPLVARSQRTLAGTVTLGDNAVLRAFDLSPPAGSRGLVGAGVTGFDVQQVSIATTGARAVDLANASGAITLTRVSSVGADRGVSLVNTNPSTGSFTVTGNGTPGSGGVVTGSTGVGSLVAPDGGVYLQGARNVTLRWMRVDENADNGIAAVNARGLTVRDTTASDNAAHGLAVVGDSAQRGDVTVTGSNFAANSSGGADVHSNGSGGLVFAISDGTITGCVACGAPISVTKGPGAIGTAESATSASIEGMTITNASSDAAPGLLVRGDGGGAVRLVIRDNDLSLVAGHGLDAVFGSTAGPAAADITVTGNTFDLSGTSLTDGIHLEAGIVPGDPTVVCAGISGNLVVSAEPNGASLATRSGAPLRLPGYVDGRGDPTVTVPEFLLGQNTMRNVVATSDPISGGFVGGVACATP